MFQERETLEHKINGLIKEFKERLPDGYGILVDDMGDMPIGDVIKNAENERYLRLIITSNFSKSLTQLHT